MEEKGEVHFAYLPRLCVLITHNILGLVVFIKRIVILGAKPVTTTTESGVNQKDMDLVRGQSEKFRSIQMPPCQKQIHIPPIPHTDSQCCHTVLNKRVEQESLVPQENFFFMYIHSQRVN